MSQTGDKSAGAILSSVLTTSPSDIKTGPATPAKSEVEALLQRLPDDCTLEDVQYHLYVIEKIRKGSDRADAEEGCLRKRSRGEWKSGLPSSLVPRSRLRPGSIAEYMARDSAYYARAVTTKRLLTARALHRFPHRGRIVPEYQDLNLRERFVYSYRLVYRIEPNTVPVVAVVHGKRLIEPGEP